MKSCCEGGGPVGQAAPGVGAVRWVVGPAGSGKTELLARWSRAAFERSSALQLWGSAWPGDDIVDLWHWRPILRRLGVEAGPDLSQLADELLAALGGLSGGFIALDDVHLADARSTQLLDVVVRHVPALPVALAVSSAALERFPPDAIVLVPTSGERPDGSAAATLTKVGEWWRLDYAGRSAHVSDRKGVSYLSELLRHPHRELHVLDLLAVRDVPIQLGGVEIADRRAVQAYRTRWAEIAEDLAEAEENSDLARVERLRGDLDHVETAVREALAINGRLRVAGGSVERARVNVTRAIRSAIARMDTVDAVVGAHLASSVRTGTTCAYRPAIRSESAAAPPSPLLATRVPAFADASLELSSA